MISAVRIGVYEQHAVSGRWPDSKAATLTGAPKAPISQSLQKIEAAGEGVIHFDFSSQGEAAALGRLSIRAAQANHALSPIISVCGYAPAPPFYRAVGLDETSISADMLPAACRSRELNLK